MRTLALGDVATYLNGKPFKPSDWEEAGTPIIRIQNLNDSTKPYNYYSRTCEERYMVRNGDVLIAWSGTLGVHEWKGPDAFLNQHIFKVVFDKEEVDKRYFIYAVDQLLQRVDNFMHGSTLTHITKKDFDPLPFLLPPLPTQRRIAAVLDKAQALVANDRRTLAVYDQLAKSLFLEMFADPVRNERGWESQKLDDLCESIVVGFVGACEQFYTGPEGVPMVRTGNLREGTLDFTNLKYVTREFHLKQRKSQLQKGDILIARHGDNGKASLYDGRFLEVNSLNIVVLRPNVKKMLPDFLINVMNFPTMRTFIASRTGGATQKVVNTREIQRLEFIVPPLGDQKRFAEKLVQVNRLMTEAEISLRRSEGLFGSLLQQAFAGGFGE